MRSDTTKSVTKRMAACIRKSGTSRTSQFSRKMHLPHEQKPRLAIPAHSWMLIKRSKSADPDRDDISAGDLRSPRKELERGIFGLAWACIDQWHCL